MKVSLFLQEGIQTSTGHIVLPGPLTNSGNAAPGEVLVFAENGDVVHKEKVDATLKRIEQRT